jgi:uncharacterized membrane protein
MKIYWILFIITFIVSLPIKAQKVGPSVTREHAEHVLTAEEKREEKRIKREAKAERKAERKLEKTTKKAEYIKTRKRRKKRERTD